MLLLLPVANASAQGDDYPAPPPQYGDTPKHAARVKEAYEDNLSKYKGDADVLVLPGVVANRKTRRIEIAAEATGLAEKDIVEFLLIDQTSEKGYESLVWSFAKPSDVHKALMFIGMKPGRPFNPAKLRFWPKGERVLLSVAAQGQPDTDRPLPIENLVMDSNSEETLPAVGFVFVGSTMIRRFDGKPGKVYAADAYEPKSVASLFNDPIAVLDVPRRARKSDVYGRQVASPEYDFAKNEPLKIILEPEHKDGRRRVKDLELDIRLSDKKPDKDALPVEFLLKDAKGVSLVEKPKLHAVLGAFGQLVQQGRDPYVSVIFDDRLRLAQVQKVCRVLVVLDSEKGIRIEPPAPGQLYYEAFLPDRRWLDRKSRLVQPFELRVTAKGGAIGAALTLHEYVWADDNPEPKMKATTFDIATPQALREQLDADAKRRREAERRPGPPVLIVFTDADIEYRQLLALLGPALETHNIVHVFIEAKKPQ